MGLPTGTYNVNYAQSMAVIRTRLQWGLFIGGLALFFALPLFIGGSWIAVLNFIGCTTVVVLGLNILTGYCGQISIGHAAFMMVGAYTTAILARYLHMPFWLTIPLSGLSAGTVGIIFGTPSLRVKGFYLAMATLAAQFIIPWLIVNVKPDVTGGTHTVPIPAAAIGDWKFTTQQSLFYLVWPVTCLMAFLAKNVVRTRLGRAFIAIRDNDLAAEVIGINVFVYKLIAFFISAFFAGVGGALYAYWMRAIAPMNFELMHSIWFLGMAVVGGLGSITGTFLGVALIRILNNFMLDLAPIVAKAIPVVSGTILASLPPLAFGFVVVIFIVFEPRGLYHRWEVIKAMYRIWPYSH